MMTDEDVPRVVYVRAGWLEKAILILLAAAVFVGVVNTGILLESQEDAQAERERARAALCEIASEIGGEVLFICGEE